MNSDRASFGVALRRLRTAAGLSQEELAERAGVSARGISDLERGARRMPHLGTVRLLAEPSRWIRLIALPSSRRHALRPLPTQSPARSHAMGPCRSHSPPSSAGSGS